MKLVLCYPLESRHFDQIAATAPQLELVDAGQGRIAEEIFEADLYCGHAKVPLPWDEVIRRGRLRWIQSSAAGLDHCLAAAVVDSDVVVTSAAGVLTDQVAEHAIMFLTALARSLPVFFRAQQQRQFVRRPTRDLHEATVGIVGLGSVGRRLAELLSGFRCRIVAVDTFPVDRPPHVAELWPAERLDDLLAACQFVVLCLPLTDQTRGLFDRRRLETMRPGSFLVNVARGPIVVEDDLAAVLATEHLAGAALDVTATEPLPATSLLWDLPNLIITPHVAGQGARRIDRMTDLLCENLTRYLAGRPLRNLVDKRLGYPVRRQQAADEEQATDGEGT